MTSATWYRTPGRSGADTSSASVRSIGRSYHPLVDFAGRYGPWALVVGASEGIGAAFARELARRGLRLVLVARRAAPLEALAAELPEARTVVADATGAEGARRVLEAVAGVDVGLLVHNAAFAPIGPFLERPLDDALAAVGLNVEATVALAHGAGSRFR